MRDVRIAARCDAETDISKIIFERYLKTADKARTDADASIRLAKQECKACYYVRGPAIGGRSMTEYKCYVCLAEKTHSSTATPRACPSCAKEIGSCMRCLGDMD